MLNTTFRYSDSLSFIPIPIHQLAFKDFALLLSKKSACTLHAYIFPRTHTTRYSRKYFHHYSILTTFYYQHFPISNYIHNKYISQAFSTSQFFKHSNLSMPLIIITFSMMTLFLFLHSKKKEKLIFLSNLISPFVLYMPFAFTTEYLKNQVRSRFLSNRTPEVAHSLKRFNRKKDKIV